MVEYKITIHTSELKHEDVMDILSFLSQNHNYMDATQVEVKK